MFGKNLESACRAHHGDTINRLARISAKAAERCLSLGETHADYPAALKAFIAAESAVTEAYATARRILRPEVV